MRRAVDLAQKVKDTPARAMLDLAQHLLEPAAVPAGAKLAAIAVASAPATSCCSPALATAATAAKGASNCC
jgi:hypothetical protein